MEGEYSRSKEIKTVVRGVLQAMYFEKLDAIFQRFCRVFETRTLKTLNSAHLFRGSFPKIFRLTFSELFLKGHYHSLLKFEGHFSVNRSAEYNH